MTISVSSSRSRAATSCSVTVESWSSCSAWRSAGRRPQRSRTCRSARTAVRLDLGRGGRREHPEGPTSSAVQALATVSMTQNDPRACSRRPGRGSPPTPGLHAAAPTGCRGSAGRGRVTDDNGARSAMTYWQNAPRPGSPSRRRRSTPCTRASTTCAPPTKVMNAIGASQQPGSQTGQPLPGVRGAAPRSPVLRTAASRAGSKTAASTPEGSALPCTVTHHYGARRHVRAGRASARALLWAVAQRTTTTLRNGELSAALASDHGDDLRDHQRSAGATARQASTRSSPVSPAPSGRESDRLRAHDDASSQPPQPAARHRRPGLRPARDGVPGPDLLERVEPAEGEAVLAGAPAPSSRSTCRVTTPSWTSPSDSCSAATAAA